MKAASLCAGIGGADLALEAHGHEIAWHAEYDAAPSKVLAARWPGVPNVGDITTADWGAMEPVDIISAGYPCQPFSTAGRRQGTTDERHIWPFVRDAIGALRPRYVFLENVEGHRSLGGAIVIADLARLGYMSGWGLLGSADIGGCHRRRRLWIVAADTSRRTVGTERLTVAGGGDPVVARLDGEAAGRGVDLLPTPVRSDGDRASHTFGRGNPTLLGALLPTPRTSDSNGPGSHGDGGDDLRAAIALLPTPTVSQGRNDTSARKPDAEFNSGTTLQDVAYSDTFGRYQAAVDRWAALFTPPPAPTTNGKLNPAFAEWMMGFPAGWVTDPALGLTRSAQLKAIGNAQQPQTAAAAFSILARRVLAELPKAA